MSMSQSEIVAQLEKLFASVAKVGNPWEAKGLLLDGIERLITEIQAPTKLPEGWERYKTFVAHGDVQDIQVRDDYMSIWNYGILGALVPIAAVRAALDLAVSTEVPE